MASVIDVKPERMNSLNISGFQLPYVEFETLEPALKLSYRGEEFAYWRTVPLKGYSAVLSRLVQELTGEGKWPLLARFGARIYVYATGVISIGSGKPPGA